MKTKTFYGVKFNVYTDSKIDGDFIKPDEAVYFENDVEITGRLEVKYLKTEKSIVVGKSYIVTEWEEVGGSQKVGEYQKVGWSQKVGWYQKVGGSQEVGGYQKVGGSQEVGGSQKVGEYQNVGESQEVGGPQEVGEYQNVGGSQKVGGDSTVGAGINVGLYIKVGGTLRFGKRLFAGICPWRDITDEEKTITCGKLEGGEVVHGIVKEVGLSNVKETKQSLSGKTVKVEVDGVKYEAIIK